MEKSWEGELLFTVQPDNGDMFMVNQIPKNCLKSERLMYYFQNKKYKYNIKVFISMTLGLTIIFIIIFYILTMHGY